MDRQDRPSQSSQTPIEKIIEREKALLTYEGDDRVVDGETYEKTRANEPPRQTFHVPSLPRLSELLHGFRTKEINIISGYTGFGKTLLAKTINHDFMGQGLKTMFFSYENSPLNILPSEPELKKNCFFLPLKLKSMNVPWLIDRIEEGKSKYGASVVFIDHLHYIIDMSLQVNMSLNIGGVMRVLVQAAQELNIMIFLIAHTAKPRPDADMPTRHDARDSSLIGQEAANFLIAHRISNQAAERLDSQYANKKNTPGRSENFGGGHGLIGIEKARDEEAGQEAYGKKIHTIKNGPYLEEWGLQTEE